MQTYTLNKTIARKVLKTVDAGLCSGIGNPTPGEMCVEAAVCYGLGLPHGDNPICVHPNVRAVKIHANDSLPWRDNAHRAEGMRKVAIAQLGSDKIDGDFFISQLVVHGIKAGKLSKLYAESRKLCAEGRKLYAGGGKLYDKGRKLCDKGRKLCAEGRKLLAALTPAKRDKAISAYMDCILQALIDCGSPGCKWLDLCEAVNA